MKSKTKSLREWKTQKFNNNKDPTRDNGKMFRKRNEMDGRISRRSDEA